MRVEIQWSDTGITPSCWYINSWRDINVNLGQREYERTYNVKMILDCGRVTHIEFPTEADAVMFILKWS